MKSKIMEWLDRRLPAFSEEEKKKIEALIKRGAHYRDYETEEEWIAKPGELPPEGRKIALILKDKEKNKPAKCIYFFSEEEF